MIAAAANRVQEHTAVNCKNKCRVDAGDWLCSVYDVYEEEFKSFTIDIETKLLNRH